MVFWQRPQTTEFNAFPTNGSTLELLHLSVHRSNLQKKKKKNTLLVCLLLQEGQDQFGFVSCNCTTHFSVFTSTEVTRKKCCQVHHNQLFTEEWNPPKKSNWTQLWKKNKKHFELLQVQHQLALISSQLSSAEYSPQEKEPLEGVRLKKIIKYLHYVLAILTLPHLQMKLTDGNCMDYFFILRECYYVGCCVNADMEASGEQSEDEKQVVDKKNNGPLHEKKRSVKSLTWISSQEAAVVVKMFVVADRSVMNALSTWNSPNTSLRHDCGRKVKFDSEIKCP